MRSLFFCIVLLSFSAGAQTNSGNTIDYNCPNRKYCMDCGVDPTFPNFEGYLYDHIDKNTVKKYPFAGHILIQVVIDSTGKACCAKITNNTEGCTAEMIKALNLDKVFSEMPLWKPASKGGKKINGGIIIKIDFLEGKQLYISKADT